MKIPTGASATVTARNGSAGTRWRTRASALTGSRPTDVAPARVWPTPLDVGVYLAGEATFYRLPRSVHGDVRERRVQAIQPARVKPEFIATKSNEVRSRDVAKWCGPAKWTCFCLYAVVDVYSRKAVGWMLATQETTALAEVLLAETIAKDWGSQRREFPP